MFLLIRFLCIFTILMLSTISDLKSGKIKNRNIIIGWICGLLLNLLEAGILSDGSMDFFSAGSKNFLGVGSMNFISAGSKNFLGEGSIDIILMLKVFAISIGKTFLVLLVGYLFYTIHAFGAGDVKLYSVIAMFFDPVFTFHVFFCGMVLVTIWIIAGYMLKKIMRKKHPDKEVKFPKTIIFAPATLCAFLIIFIINLV